MSWKMIGGFPRNPFDGVPRPMDSWMWRTVSNGGIVDIYEVRNGVRRTVVLAEAHGFDDSITAFRHYMNQAREAGTSWEFLIEGWERRGSDFKKYGMDQLVDTGATVHNLPDASDGCLHLVQNGLATIEEWVIMDVLEELFENGIRRQAESGYGVLNDAAMNVQKALIVHHHRLSLRGILNWVRAALATPERLHRAIHRSTRLSCESLWVSNELQSHIIQNAIHKSDASLLILIGAAHLGSVVSQPELISQSTLFIEPSANRYKNIQWILENAVPEYARGMV